MPPLPRYAYRVAEVAEMLGNVSERYVWTLIQSGELPSTMIAKKRMVLHDDLQAFLARLRADEQRARAAAAGGAS